MPEAYFFSFLPNFKLGKKQKKYIFFFLFFFPNFNLKLGKKAKKVI